MLVVILLYDQLLFRPLVAWADKFRFEQTGAQDRAALLVPDVLQRARIVDLLLRSRWRSSRAATVSLRAAIAAAPSRRMRPNVARIERHARRGLVGARRRARRSACWICRLIVAPSAGLAEVG